MKFVSNNLRKKYQKIKSIISDKTWECVRKDYEKKETEDLIFAAQEEVLRTNWIRKNIDDKRYQKNGECVGKKMSKLLDCRMEKANAR